MGDESLIERMYLDGAKDGKYLGNLSVLHLLRQEKNLILLCQKGKALIYG